MEELNDRLKNNDKRGRKGTIIVHSLLLLAFLFFGLTGPFPPPEEEGILISFGQPNVGSGNTQPTSKTAPPPPSKSTPKKSTPTPKPPVKKITPKIVTPAPAPPVIKPIVESVIPEKVATQKTVEAPSVSPKIIEKIIEEKKEIKPIEKVEEIKPVIEEVKEVKPIETKQESKEVKKAPQEAIEETKAEIVETKPPSKPAPTVDPRALYGGSKSNKDSNTSQGDTGRPGDQGAPDGDPNASNTKGDRSTGLGKTGSGSELVGRARTHKPECTDNSQVQGVIKVQIHVGSDGVVRRADFMQKGSSTTDSRLVQKAISCAKQYKYNSDPYAPEIQTGIVTFNFTF